MAVASEPIVPCISWTRRVGDSLVLVRLDDDGCGRVFQEDVKADRGVAEDDCTIDDVRVKILCYSSFWQALR